MPHDTTTPEPPDGPVTVALIVASTRPQRLADALLPWLETRLRELAWVKLEVVDLADVEIPWSAPLHGVPGPLSDVLTEADAFVILTPEYNHSFPGPLKQVIDAHHAEWAYKPVTFVAYGAASGGLRAIEQLRLVFPELRATTTRNAVALTSPWYDLGPTGYQPPPRAEAALAATLEELRWWALTLREGRQRRPPA